MLVYTQSCVTIPRFQFTVVITAGRVAAMLALLGLCSFLEPLLDKGLNSGCLISQLLVAPFLLRLL
jgi:hypothetical protein